MSESNLPEALYVWANELGIGAKEWRRRVAALNAAEAALAPVAEPTPSEWASAAEWLRNNYQDYANVASLCEAMINAAPRKGE